ncbi:MAG: NlpC/P60 family protein [Stackebrandtia sp.]
MAVATLWTQPGEDRPVDAPSTANPVDLRKWLGDMSLGDRRWLVGKLQTQALYGQEVTVLQVSGDWAEVAVHGQPTPKHELGYPGWMPRGQLSDTPPGSQDEPFALVEKATAWSYDDEGLGDQFAELSYNTRLPVVSRTETAVRVGAPSHGDKWLSVDDVSIYDSDEAIPPPTGEDLVASAELFVGLAYLWSGASGFGFDCSGFTHVLYKAHGVTIPRDAGDQSDAGRPVSAEELEPGDLLFYGERIHHVGMYVGDGRMIDARTNSDTQDSFVEIVPVDEHPYAHEYAGAARFLD